MSELKKLRTKIDGLDRRIVGLLNQRLATVGKIGEWKAERKLASYSPSRSAEIMRHVQKANKGPHAPEQLAAIYQKIIAASVALQAKQKKTVGGAFLSTKALATAERPDSAKTSRHKAAPTVEPSAGTRRKK